MYAIQYLDDGLCSPKKKRRKTSIREEESLKKNSYRYATVLEG